MIRSISLLIFLLLSIGNTFGQTAKTDPDAGGQDTVSKITAEQPKYVFVVGQPEYKSQKKKPRSGFLTVLGNAALGITSTYIQSRISNTSTLNYSSSQQQSNNWTTPNNNWTTPVQQMSKPVQNWSTPVQMSTPNENWSTPVKQMSAPVENWSTPVQMSKPNENWSTTVKQMSTPVENWSTPVQLSTPNENWSTPVKQMSTPVENWSTPVQLSTPNENWSTPVKQISTPVQLSTPNENWSTPSRQMSTPVQLSTVNENWGVPVVLTRPINLSNSIELSSMVMLNKSTSRLRTRVENSIELKSYSEELKKIVGRGLGTTIVDKANDWYLRQYIQSVVNGHPNKFYLAGVGATSLWTTDNYLKTLNAFSLATLIPEKAVFYAGEAGLFNFERSFGSAISNTSKINAELAKLGRSSIFEMDPLTRGYMAEEMLGGNLTYGSRVFDKLINREVTSIKSIDVTASSYTKGNGLSNKLNDYINTLSSFKGDNTIKEGVDFSKKSLEVVIQQGKTTAEQFDQIKKSMEYAKSLGIDFKLVFVR